MYPVRDVHVIFLGMVQHNLGSYILIKINQIRPILSEEGLSLTGCINKIAVAEAKVDHDMVVKNLVFVVVDQRLQVDHLLIVVVQEVVLMVEVQFHHQNLFVRLVRLWNQLHIYLSINLRILKLTR